MKYGKVGVLLGGTSAEREISIKSGKAISAALRRQGVEVIEIGEKEAIEDGIKKYKIDLAFIALHGAYGEDGKVQAFLESQGIFYTGSGKEASEIAIDKIKTKEILIRSGILVPDYAVLNKEEKNNIQLDKLGVPLVVKPATEGSSIGLQMVFQKENFEEAVRESFKYSDQLLLERYISGLELTVGILGEQALPIINVVPKNKFYDFEAKYTKGKTEYIIPARIEDSDVYRRIQEIALESYKAVGCRDMSRVDIIFVEATKKIYVLEINTIPGFTETSLLPKAAQEVGIEFDDLCIQLLEMAWKRRAGENRI